MPLAPQEVEALLVVKVYQVVVEHLVLKGYQVVEVYLEEMEFLIREDLVLMMME